MPNKSISRHLALIPARGGSTGVKDKNLQRIDGKSLVSIAWDNCLEAKLFDNIMLSTDSQKIAHLIFPDFSFQEVGNDSITFVNSTAAVHKRHKKLSTKHSSIYDLLKHIALKSELNFDYLWLIQPTTPFRCLSEFSKISRMINQNSHFTSIVSIKNVGGSHPDRMYSKSTKYLRPLMPKNNDKSIPRQKLPSLFIKDGGYYVFRRNLLNKNIYLGKHILPFIRSNEGNVNIDTIDDLNYARFIAKINKE